MAGQEGAWRAPFTGHRRCGEQRLLRRSRGRKDGSAKERAALLESKGETSVAHYLGSECQAEGTDRPQVLATSESGHSSVYCNAVQGVGEMPVA